MKRELHKLISMTCKLPLPGNLGLCTFHKCSGSSSGSKCGMASYASISALSCCLGDKTGQVSFAGSNILFRCKIMVVVLSVVSQS